jgi:hypothetical protein
MPDKVEAAILLLLMSASIAAVTKNWDVALVYLGSAGSAALAHLLERREAG